MLISPCGYYCSGCSHYQDRCKGCASLKGKPWWVKYYDIDNCPIYGCVQEKKIADCGQCDRIPCQTWTDLKDPSYSDYEHKAKIGQRVNRLKKSRKAQRFRVSY